MPDNEAKRHYFLRLFEEGKAFTAELLEENEKLRRINLRLKEETKSTEDLTAKLKRLEDERNTALDDLRVLRGELEAIESRNRDYAERYARIERQNGNLASLYVASYNLHSTLAPAEVVRCIKEIVVNLIGSEKFGIYLLHPTGESLQLLDHEGLDTREYETQCLTGIVAHSVRDGVVALAPESSPPEPLASIPLKISDKTFGAVVLYALLGHKPTFAPLDMELLELLADHAATALYGSKLYAESTLSMGTVEDFHALLRAAEA